MGMCRTKCQYLGCVTESPVSPKVHARTDTLEYGGPQPVIRGYKSEKSKVIVFSLPLGKVKSSSRQPRLYLIGAAGYDQLRMSI